MCAEAGQRSAVIYLVLGSSLSLGINPAEYLQDLFECLPKAKTSEIKSLTPAARLQILKPLTLTESPTQMRRPGNLPGLR